MNLVLSSKMRHHHWVRRISKDSENEKKMSHDSFQLGLMMSCAPGNNNLLLPCFELGSGRTWSTEHALVRMEPSSFDLALVRCARTDMTRPGGPKELIERSVKMRLEPE